MRDPTTGPYRRDGLVFHGIPSIVVRSGRRRRVVTALERQIRRHGPTYIPNVVGVDEAHDIYPIHAVPTTSSVVDIRGARIDHPVDATQDPRWRFVRRDEDSAAVARMTRQRRRGR
jgi:hypothetical protein